MPENVKPSQAEEEYFAKEDAERKRAHALKVQQEMAEAERKRLREVHFMHCPKCGQTMQEVRLLGVDVDVCFACKGIFLDSGELETLRAHGKTKQGIVTAILNWFRPESETKGRTSFGTRVPVAVLRGMAKVQSRFVLLLDLERLLGDGPLLGSNLAGAAAAPDEGEA